VAGPAVRAAFAARDDVVADVLRAEGCAAVAHHRSRAPLPFAVAAQIPGLLDALGPDDVVAWRDGRDPVPARFAVDADRAWLLGLYVADGHRPAGRAGASDVDRAILDRVSETLTGLGLTADPDPGTGVSALSALLEWLGAGCDAITRRVPEVVWGWPHHLVEAFLDGVVAGGGSVEGGRISVRTTSPALADDLLLVFARLGWPAASRRLPARGTAVPCWQVDAPGHEDTVPTGVPLPVTDDRLDRVVAGDLLWDEVVAVHDTGMTETIYDLEVRPGGRKIENFLAGSGGVFVSNTAGFIDAGFSGHITLELSNVANLPITLYPGMKIGQVSFLQMTTPADVPYGSAKVGSKYQGQRGPTPSRYWENFDDSAADGG
jgi:hypothetical protein